MTPNTICDLIQSYYDGQLEEEDLLMFNAHLDECVQCRVELSELNQLSDFFRATQECVADTLLFDNAWRGVEKELIRERLSFVDVTRKPENPFVRTVRKVCVPALAVGFAFLIVFLPTLMEKEGTYLTDEFAMHLPPATIGSVRTQAGAVMIMKTKNNAWPVIWVFPEKEE